ncbi:MAG: hypothetical protein H7Y60_02080 [Rhodospirillaceae bacterium]|nr:hypothetical protein [Rhodospirillales bacterium]
MLFEADAAACRERVLIYAPFGRDPQVILDVLAGAGVCGTICPTVRAFCTEIAAGAGAAIMAMEAIGLDELHDLAGVLTAQPPWSDLPLIVLFHSSDAAASEALVLASLFKVGNLNLLERPLRIDALLNAVTLALRARRRQYQAEAHMRDLVEAQEHLAQARNEAVRANLAKSRFLAAASHDLRQPFQAMLLYHHMVTDAVQGTPAAQAAKALGEAINSGEDLLNSLLDLSTLDAGVTKVEIAEIQVLDVLQTVANDLGAVAAGKGLGLRVHPCTAHPAQRSGPVEAHHPQPDHQRHPLHGTGKRADRLSPPPASCAHPGVGHRDRHCRR